MARAHKQSAQLTPAQMRSGVQRLTRVLGDLRRFNPGNVTNQNNVPEIPRLSAAVDEALARTFGADTLDYERYRRATDLARRLINGPPLPIEQVRAEFERVKARSIGLLEQAITGLEEKLTEPADDPPDAIAVPSVAPPTKQPAELLQLKPQFMGFSIDLKELGRRGLAWWRGLKR
jgi:hypothetical protein